MMDPVADIKTRIPLEDIVGETVALKPAGRERLKGLCPFHAEKTPSFHISTDKGVYYCFSCQASGDVFSFVQATRSVEFRGALELLAERAGITLPERRERTQNRDLYDLQSLAQAYFLEGLAASEGARTYLAGRGLTDETVTRWGLGYAPEGWQGLVALARRQNVQPEALERAGLAKIKDRRPYDLFRGRVTIPIKDPFGRIVGFSARILGPGEPKYLNTPETDIFKKGDLLFGLSEAKATLRASRAAILAEGQLDVIALHQAGFTAAVGAQSATLTPAQIATLDRLGVATLYPAFDADAAGQRATLAALDAVARLFLCKVVLLPGKDPAEIVAEDPELFRTALKRALSEPRYRLAEALKGLDVTNPQHKQTALERLKSGLADAREPFDPVAGELRRLVAERLGLDESKLAPWARSRRVTAKVLVPEPATKIDVRHEIMALALNDATHLRDHVARIESMVNPGDTLLTQFVADCERCAYDTIAILRHYSGHPGMAPVFAELVQPVDAQADLLGLALNRYMRETLPPSTELSKALAQAMRAARNPTTSVEERQRNRAEAERLMDLMRMHVALR